MNKYNLLGVGVGPFNLSLAALLDKVPNHHSLFFEKKDHFEWHSEVMFADSNMQTNYLKDLVTPVDPTSPYSFLNYLVEQNLFYPFLNTQRSVVSRREFEQYFSWAAGQLQHRLRFGTEVESVHFKNNSFVVQTSQGVFASDDICIATGVTPRIPDCARPFLGPRIFHAKSHYLKSIDLSGKSVLIVGGGQTGVEVFRNAIHDHWGRAKSITLATRRKSLEPLDESAFTNEYFTPNYVERFWHLPPDKKSQIVADQKLASDGNTPAYLSQLYNDLYRLKYVEKDPRPIHILACRKLEKIQSGHEVFRLGLFNSFIERNEEILADIVILCTGFESAIPMALEPLIARIQFDDERRFKFNKAYNIEWDGPSQNRIYALNFSRHNHGIIDPQTSLMAWRSAVVVNDLLRSEIYSTRQKFENFIDYGTESEKPQFMELM